MIWLLFSVAVLAIALAGVSIFALVSIHSELFGHLQRTTRALIVKQNQAKVVAAFDGDPVDDSFDVMG